MEHFGFHSRASRCASAIWTGVILAAFRWLGTGLSPLRALLSARRESSLSSSEGAQPLLRPLHLVVPPDRPADALVRAMGRHRTAGAGSGSSRTPLIHPAPFRAPQILLVVIGRRSASASASPSRGLGNGILRAETGGRIQAQNAGERPEFGSQTTLRLANRPKLTGRATGVSAGFPTPLRALQAAAPSPSASRNQFCTCRSGS